MLIALKDLKSGEPLPEITPLEDIPRGHKIALRDIREGEDVLKYGAPIGRALKPIPKGSHVHVHNLSTGLGSLLKYEYAPKFLPALPVPGTRKFLAFRREDGRIGIRNELWILPTVGCITGIAKKIAEAFRNSLPSGETLPDLHVFSHPYGCSQMGDDLQNTRESLQNIARHPNAGGVLVLGLGCENNQISEFRKGFGAAEPRVRFLVLQEVGDEVSEGVKILRELHDRMKGDVRTEADLSELRVGLKCGGSDGFSGLTANPLLGRFSDWLVAHGGTSVLTEVPEMFGAETRLMARAADRKVFEGIVDLVNGFKTYYARHGQVIYDNPSPGNKQGGITTLEEKSLGCIEKGGSTPVEDVLPGTGRLRKKGLCLIAAPGNDLVSTTVLGMSGCHLVLFTTGRGTPFGGFVPTVKVSSNTELFERKPGWIDFDAGSLVGGKPMDELLDEFIGLVIRVASGEPTKNETNDFREIAIFKDGVTL